eukprot:CAMPEP_0182539476 /NCGR_PEP_ID=MMETSP1323-20130603/25457_1 /TAXON_ID=236787 /ORGANISM="Florenciella parvula, Strain RCC1693" /LENGTH=103 /DNA_ID=CAMNT_0024750045 /DNA_START=234 /DNA_END=542 /DNA_ORIENTATION=+
MAKRRPQSPLLAALPRRRDDPKADNGGTSDSRHVCIALALVEPLKQRNNSLLGRGVRHGLERDVPQELHKLGKRDKVRPRLERKERTHRTRGSTRAVLLAEPI